MMKNAAGENIRTRRNSLGLSQDQVAEYLGVNRATVQRYESGDIEIKRSVAEKLALILKTTPSFVMGWEEKEDDSQNRILLLTRKVEEMPAEDREMLENLIESTIDTYLKNRLKK